MEKIQDSDSLEAADKYVYGPKRLIIALTLTLVMFLMLLDTTIVVTV